MGWGQNAYISEYTADGTMVQQGHFATTGAMHYRSRKANFTIHPTNAPSIYTYALNTNHSTQYCVSWNGATEVRGWRIYTASGSSSSNPKFKVLATVAKEGFETIYTANSYHQWSIVQALDASGKGYGTRSGWLRRLSRARNSRPCATRAGVRVRRITRRSRRWRTCGIRRPVLRSQRRARGQAALVSRREGREGRGALRERPLSAWLEC
jgi:hypothetical protein